MVEIQMRRRVEIKLRIRTENLTMEIHHLPQRSPKVFSLMVIVSYLCMSVYSVMVSFYWMSVVFFAALLIINIDSEDLLNGLPAYLVQRLQSVLNAAARMIFHLRSVNHITDVPATLCWLHVLERIEYKIAQLTFKSSTSLKCTVVPWTAHSLINCLGSPLILWSSSNLALEWYEASHPVTNIQ